MVFVWMYYDDAGKWVDEWKIIVFDLTGPAETEGRLAKILMGCVVMLLPGLSVNANPIVRRAVGYRPSIDKPIPLVH